MNKKRFLQQAWELKKEIRRLEKTIEELKARDGSIKGIDYSVEKYQTNQICTDNVIIEKLDKINEYCKRVSELLVELKEKQIDIAGKIEDVEDVACRELLTYRYIRNLTWEQVAEESDCSLRQVYYLHKKAIKMIKI